MVTILHKNGEEISNYIYYNKLPLHICHNVKTISDLTAPGYQDNSNIGITGKLGRAILLLNVYQSTKDQNLRENAELMLEEIADKASDCRDLSYDKGLSGIGVGMEYILQQHYIDGDSDDVLSDIDNSMIKAINLRTFDHLDLDDGILGIAYYMYTRLIYRLESESVKVFTLKENTLYLIDWIYDMASKKKLIHHDFDEAKFILHKLLELNLFNFKVEKIISLINQQQSIYKNETH